MLAALAGAGCTTSPPPREPAPRDVAVRATWSTNADSSPTILNWWRTFGDEDLDSTVAAALSGNLDLRAVAARIAIASGQAGVSYAGALPQVSAGASASRQRSSVRVPEAGGGEKRDVLRSNSFRLSLDVSWELDVWGRIRAQNRAANAGLQAAKADYAGARLSLAGQAAKAWLQLTEAKLQVELAQETVKSFAATERRASDRVAAGIQPPSDRHLARTNHASARELLQLRLQAQDAAKRRLEVLLGRYPSGAIKGGATLPSLPPTPPMGFPAEILRRRPDLVAAERRLAASLQDVEAAEKAFYPRLSLTTSGGLSSSELKDLFSAESLIWTVAGNLVQPIFEGGRLWAQLDVSRGRQAEASALFAQRVLDALGEVERFLRAEQFLALRQVALEEAAQEALAAVAVTENRYGQGVESFIVVLESQRRALSAQSALISLRRERLETRVDLHLALGGGFEEWMPEIPEPEPDTAEELE